MSQHTRAASQLLTVVFDYRQNLGRGLEKHRARDRCLLIKSVAVGVCSLLVRHRTRVALAATRRRVVLAFATGVGVLTLPLFLATRHGFPVFATARHVAARVGALVSILRGIQS